MSLFILSPDSLPQLSNDSPSEVSGGLQVNDSRDDHAACEGDGLWIPVFLEFLERAITTHCHLPEFHFPSNDHIDESILDEIPSRYGRTLAASFINAQYHDWLAHDVVLPSYDRISSDCRGFCDDCEHAHREILDEDGEVIDTEWACEEDCDSFIDYVDESYRQAVNIDPSSLEVRLADFVKFEHEAQFPPLHDLDHFEGEGSTT